MTAQDPATETLLRLMAGRGRGPEREGLFALWLVVRVLGTLASAPLSDRTTRRQIAALEHRLSSLTLPPPLHRALASCLLALKEPSPALAPILLAQLVAPARDGAGPEAAAAVALAARLAREARPTG